MELYFYICGIFAILSLFGVFESFERSCGLNRWFVCVFFVLSMIFSVVPNIEISNFYVNLNLFLFIFVTFCFVVKKNTVRGIVSAFIVCLITIALFVCLSAANFSSEFAFVKPYFYVAIVSGIMGYFLCTNFYNMFVGTFVGVELCEIVMHNIFLNVDERFIFANIDTLTYVIVCAITYVVIFGMVNMINAIKIKRIKKNRNLAN